jgi:aryl-alcohol dehydrogenase-like predicted oxidoreductase
MTSFLPTTSARRRRSACATSDVNTIDVQQFHVWSDAWATDDRWHRAVDALKREGLVRAIGISVNRWEPANVLRALETGLIDSVQVVYNIFDQNPEGELFPACRERGVAVIAGCRSMKAASPAR